MTIFCPILAAHNTDCVSLASLVNNVFIAYLLVMFPIYYLLKNVKSPSKPIKLLQDYYVKNKIYSLVFDLVYIGFVFSLSFLIYRIMYVELLNRNIKVKPLVLFLMINSVMIVIGSMLSGVIINNGKNILPSLKEWSKYGIKALLFDLIFFNIVALLAFSIMLLGYSNIVIAPIFIGLALKMFT